MGRLILNVDDFEPQRYTRSSILRAAGFTVIEAGTGRDALALARSRHPDVVLLDVQLPDISGLQVCREIKSDSAVGAGMMVLHVSSTFREPSYRTAALNNGADAYLAEPVEPDELVAHVNALVRLLEAEERARIAQRALEAAKELAEAREAEIASIYDSAPIGLCIFDTEGRYLRVNRWLAEINGLPPDAHVGRRIREVVPGLADQAEELLRRVVSTGEPARGIEFQGQVPSQPGVVHTYVENWYPVRDAEGRVVAVNVGVEEITARKQAEEDLRRANRVKDDFLATLSHELRTPLTAILGWSHLLEHGRLDEANTRHAVEAIAKNADAQRQLVSDVLDVSRMMAGKLRLDVSQVDVADVIGRAISTVQPALDAKGIGLDLVATIPGAIVSADPNRLHQVIWNLLSNAVKFTPEGGRITVRLERHNESLDIVVSDTGSGIAPWFLPHVFDRFAQADTGKSRRHGGLGLGLAIVRQIVELHGGTVRADSDGEGKGSTFTVRLPFRAVCEEAPAAGRQDAGAVDLASMRLVGLRVLIVDDVEDARTLVKFLVEGAGGLAFVARSGPEALASLPQTLPDVVLADLGMPGMDGYEFLRRLRADTSLNRCVPVIALTAYGSEADREAALAAGFAAHLAKPAMPDDIIIAVAAAAGRTVSRSRG